MNKQISLLAHWIFYMNRNINRGIFLSAWVIFSIASAACVRVKGHRDYRPLLAYAGTDSRVYFKQQYLILGPDTAEVYNLVSIDLKGKKKKVIYSDEFLRNYIHGMVTSISSNKVCYSVNSAKDRNDQNQLRRTLYVYNPKTGNTLNIFQTTGVLDDCGLAIKLLHLSQPYFSDTNYEWSPDAKNIIFTVIGEGMYLAEEHGDGYRINRVTDRNEFMITWAPNSQIYATNFSVSSKIEPVLTIRDIQGNILAEFHGLTYSKKLCFKGDSTAIYTINDQNEVIEYEIDNQRLNVIAKIDESEDIEIMRATGSGEQFICATARGPYYCSEFGEDPVYAKLFYIDRPNRTTPLDISDYLPDKTFEIQYLEWIDEDRVMLLHREKYVFNLSIINIKEKSAVRVLSDVSSVALSPDKSFAIVGGEVIYRVNIDNLEHPKIIY